MTAMWPMLVFLVTFSLAVLMGFAIQRGATCTVAAVDEFMTSRRATRLAGMAEASLWVAGGLLVAKAAGWSSQAPAGYALDVATVSGAFMLGLGAYINRGCVFGTIARLSGGDVAYLVTPLGFYIGCIAFTELPHVMTPQSLPEPSAWSSIPAVWAWIVVVAMLARLLVGVFRASPQGQPATNGLRALQQIGKRIWSPRPATVVIGIAFLFLWLLAGSWAYTDVLAQWARGMAGADGVRAILVVALFAGALWGGQSSGRWRYQRPEAARLLSCAAGGFLMGWGSQWIPGGNDGLILVGMPLMWPYAWVAFLVMCLTIAALMHAENRIKSRPT